MLVAKQVTVQLAPDLQIHTDLLCFVTNPSEGK